MSVDWLADHLREILNPSIYSDEECKVKLVPNFCGTRLYDGATCWGRLWSVIWTLLSLLDWRESCRNEALFTSVQAVYDAWIQKREEVRELSRLYHLYLSHAIHPQEPIESLVGMDELKRIQKALFTWNNKVMGAIEQEGAGSIEQKILKVQAVFTAILGVEEFDDMQQVIDDEQNIYALIRVQKKIKHTYPLKAFYKLSQRQQLTYNDQRRLSDFIPKVQAAYMQEDERKKISVRHLHAAIRLIINEFDASVNHINALEWPIHQALVEQGCQIFYDCDPEHVRWAKSYSSGRASSLVCNDVQFQAGRQLRGSKAMEDDRHLVFEKDLQTVAVISLVNRAALRFEWIELQKNNWGLPLPRVIDIDDQCAIYERLAEIPEGEKIFDDADPAQKSRRINSIISVCKWMAGIQSMPEGLSLKMAGFDQEDGVRFFKPAQKVPLDIEAVRCFVRECTQEDDASYRCILQAINEA